MHGRKDQKNANDSGNTVSGELDEQALTRLASKHLAINCEFPCF
jgi:hypothetical protein